MVTPMNSDRSCWLTINRAAKYANLCPKTVRKEIKAGHLRACKRTRKYLIHEDWLFAWILGYGQRLTPSAKREIQQLRGEVHS